MWKKRLKRIVIIIVAVIAVGVAGIAWLWSDRPDLGRIGWSAPAVSSSVVTDSVVVTWLGVTTLLFDDGETQILVDGFFSRPSVTDVLFGRAVDNDAPMINFALDEFRMRRLAAIIPVHSHFDHAMDIGAIANRTSASVLGSASTAAIAHGAGVPEDQISTVIPNKPYAFGQFTVTLLPSPHAPIGWRGSVPLPGTIDEPLSMPQPVTAWREGGSFTLVISHPDGTTVVQGSAGIAADTLRDVTADAVMISVGGLESLGKDYAERYWQSLVTATGARSVYPIHFDDYTRPFGEIVPGPKILGNLATTTIWFEDFRDRWDNDARLFMPEFGQAIAIYAQPAPGL